MVDKASQEPSAHMSRFTAVILVLAIAAYSFLVRCMHLFNHNHYYIISPDSHFFHWQAEQLLAGKTIPMTWHSGLTYPLFYAAKAISFIFGTSSENALSVACKLLPPALGVITVVVIYLGVSKMYNRRVALFSAFVWAVVETSYFIQAAGYIDRDCLTVLLIMIGAFLFYFSRDWHLRLWGVDIGWVLGAVAVVFVAFLLYVEWLWYGVAVLLAILIATVVVEMVAKLWDRLSPDLKAQGDFFVLPTHLLKEIPGTVKSLNWRPLALVLALCALVGSINPGIGYLYHNGMGIIRDAFYGSSGVSELHGIGPANVLAYGASIIPILIGLYLTVRYRRRADLLCLGWFGCLCLAGLFASRLFLYISPVVSIIGGLGLASLLDFGQLRLSLNSITVAIVADMGLFLRYSRVAAGIVLLVLLILMSSSAYNVGTPPPVAASSDWVDALDYLRDTAPKEAVVMSWWDYGYWILDIADRRPVVDNGLHWRGADEDVAMVYAATEDGEAVRLMEKYGATYLIFSTVDYRIMSVITEYAIGKSYGDDKSIPQEMKHSLYARSLSDSSEFSGGLERVYPDPAVAKPEVVILKLV